MVVQRRVEAPKEEAEDDGGRDESTMRRLLLRVRKIYRKVFRGKFSYKSFRESQTSDKIRSIAKLCLS